MDLFDRSAFCIFDVKCIMVPGTIVAITDIESFCLFIIMHTPPCLYCMCTDHLAETFQVYHFTDFVCVRRIFF